MTPIRRSVGPRAALLTLLLMALVPSIAHAAGSFPYDPTQSEPQQSVNLTAGPGPLGFKIVSPDCPSAPVYIEVSDQNVFGPDDTLIDSSRKDYFTLTETSAGVYQGQTAAQWLATPGTYYWQAQAVAKRTDVYDVPRASPVRAIVIHNAPPAPGSDVEPEFFEDTDILSLSFAKAEIPRLILKKTRRVARGLKRKCSRRGEGSLRVVLCTTSWTDKKKYRYNGSMRIAQNDDGTLSVRFDGRRASLRCWKARKKAKKRQSPCYKRYRFKYASV